MLKSHMDAVENHLMSIYQILANSGHPLHRDTPRETFSKEFFEGHLSANVAIGKGEIIDSNSQPRAQRNQYDIVIYKNNYPKLDFGGGINGFLIESVIATIEVKSLLDQSAIDQSVRAAHNAKKLTPYINRTFSLCRELQNIGAGIQKCLISWMPRQARHDAGNEMPR